MDEITKKDIAKFTAIPAVQDASRVTTPAQTTQRSWEAPQPLYVLLIEDSPTEYILTIDDNGNGLLIA